MHQSPSCGAALCLALSKAHIPRPLIWFFSHETRCNDQEGVVARAPLGPWEPGSCPLARSSEWLSTPRIPYLSPLASVYGRPPGLGVFEGWFNLASGRLFKNDEDRNFTAGLFVGHVTILTCLGRERPGQASLGIC